MQSIIRQIAAEIRVQDHQVQAAISLLDSGATVPFIARYRKEATGGLDDIQLRELAYRLGYLRELRDRCEAILKSIDEQGKLTPALRAAIEAAPTKQELEDLYLPYKIKRRTKGQIAREAGIEPLADRLFADPTLDPQVQAQAFVKAEKGEGGEDYTSTAAVLDGVRDILSERWAEDPALVQSLREWLWSEGLFRSKLAAGKDEQHPDIAKFRDYFDYDEPIARVGPAQYDNYSHMEVPAYSEHPSVSTRSTRVSTQSRLTAWRSGTYHACACLCMRARCSAPRQLRVRSPLLSC